MIFNIYSLSFSFLQSLSYYILNRENLLFQKSVVFTIAIILLLWLVKSLETAFWGSIAHLGVYPRTLEGTIGIIASPLIHGSFQHLLANSLSWLLLGVFFFFFYDRIALKVILILYPLVGFLVWIFGRDAYHIGFSGILFGVASFILISGFIRQNISALVLSFSVLVLFGGMFYGVLPTNSNISWEAHLMGMSSGLVLALVFRNQLAGMVDLKLHPEVSESEENIDLSESAETEEKDEQSLYWEQDFSEFDESNNLYQYTYKEKKKTDQEGENSYTIDKTKGN